MNKRKKPIRLGIIGATGAVGFEVLRLLEKREVPIDDLRLFASPKSVGKTEFLNDKSIVVETLPPAEDQHANFEIFRRLDYAIFSAGSEISRKYGPCLRTSRCIMIDNSSAFRMDDDVPLVIPEINPIHPDDLRGHNYIIANPNCSTAIAMMALHPLHQAYGLKSIIASTYQAVSGTGEKAIKELQRETRQWVEEGHIKRGTVYPHQIAFNLLPFIGKTTSGDFTDEEMKMQNEGRKILGLPDFKADVTCVRVPVFRSHSISITASFEEKPDESIVRIYRQIENYSGIKVMDNMGADIYPMPIKASGEEDCFIGRMRHATVMPNSLSFWVVGDQLLKGAALNAVQILEHLMV